MAKRSIWLRLLAVAGVLAAIGILLLRSGERPRVPAMADLSNGPERDSRDEESPQFPASRQSDPAAPATAMAPIVEKAAHLAVQDRRARVRGVVVDASGQGVADAAVEIRRALPIEAQGVARTGSADASRRSCAATRSSSSGEFAFDGIARGAAYEIVARSARGSGSVPIVAVDGDEIETRIELSDLWHVMGTVVEEGSNSPVAGARVSCRPITSDGGRHHVAITDETGRFDLGEIAGRRATLIAASSDGRVSAPLNVALGPESQAECVMEVPPCEAPWNHVEGVVLDAVDGRPIANAEIVLRALGDVIACRTRDDGTFQVTSRLDWELPGFECQVEAAGYASTRAILPPQAFPPPRVTVAMRRGYDLVGRVLGPERGAVEGAAATAWPMPMDEVSAPKAVSTDEEGAFRIRCLDPTIAYQLTIRHGAFAIVRRTLEARSDAAGEWDLGELLLEPGAMVLGKVVDDRGDPVESAFVSLLPIVPDADGVADEAERPGANDARRIRELGGTRRSTGADGSFAFSGVEPGDHEVVVEHLLSRRRQVVTISLSPGGDVRDLVVALRTGLSIAGRVIDARGHPVARARIAVASRSTAGGKADSTRVVARSGDDGAFEFASADPGLHTLVVRPVTNRLDPRKLLEATVSNIAEGDRAVVVVLPDGHSILGTVVGENAVSSLGASVCAVDPNGLRVATSWCDEEGRFELIVPAGETFRIEARRRSRDNPFGAIHGEPDAEVESVRPGASDLILTLGKDRE